MGAEIYLKIGCPEPPKIGDKVYVVISEHWYPEYYYPEFKDAAMKYAPCPAPAVVKELQFFQKGCNLTPTVRCVSHQRGNQNNVHFVLWPKGKDTTLFTSREECIKKCEKIADHMDNMCINERFGMKCLRPWRDRTEEELV